VSWKPLIVTVGALAPLALIAWGGFRWYKTGAVQRPASEIPITTVKRGDVVFDVTARGELQGGNSEMLTAPMMGGAELILTSLH